MEEVNITIDNLFKGYACGLITDVEICEMIDLETNLYSTTKEKEEYEAY